MNTYLSVPLVLLGLAGAAQASTVEQARRAIAHWPDETKAQAEAVIDAHGAPSVALADRLEWVNVGQFQKIAVRAAPSRQGAAVEETIRYDVPKDRKGELAFGGGCAVTPDRANAQMTSLCDGEASSLLALNLADEIMRGGKSFEQARADFERTLRLRAAGKSSPATERLLFEVKSPRGRVYKVENGGWIDFY